MQSLAQYQRYQQPWRCTSASVAREDEGKSAEIETCVDDLSELDVFSFICNIVECAMDVDMEGWVDAGPCRPGQLVVVGFVGGR